METVETVETGETKSAMVVRWDNFCGVIFEIRHGAIPLKSAICMYLCGLKRANHSSVNQLRTMILTDATLRRRVDPAGCGLALHRH